MRQASIVRHFGAFIGEIAQVELAVESSMGG